MAARILTLVVFLSFAGGAHAESCPAAEQGEQQLHAGQPWLALETLDTAPSTTDHCNARVHLTRSRIFRIDSHYASERKELDAANQLDPKDPDVHRAWVHTVNPANDIVRIQDSLATLKDLEPDVRARAQASATAMLSLLSENSRTCQSPPLTEPVTLPLLPAYENIKEITGYKLEVQLPRGKARLIVDTAASGIYLSRQLADANGLERGDNAPPGTVQAATVQAGPLTLRDCMVGVSEDPFPAGVDGYIGSDLFAAYLVTFNFPQAKLELLPLPGPAPLLPADRYAGPEVAAYAPVYHKSQYLFVPVTLNKKERRLFALDTGIRLTTMTSSVAHAISNTKLNFTNPLRTVSGSTLQIYRDGFDFQFADLALDRKDHVLEYDPTAVEQSAGMEIAGLLGFDILHTMILRLDYRDGLVQFDAPASSGFERAAAAEPTTKVCPSYEGQSGDRPINTAIRGKVYGWLDSAHLKPGQAVQLKVAEDWIAPRCKLPAGAMLYGHVLAAKAAKGDSQLAIAFDQGDCAEHRRQPMTLRLVALRDASATAAVHSVLPTEVAGGARSISGAAVGLGSQSDDDMRAGSSTYHPGMVNGIEHLKLALEAGPQCSALMKSEERSVHLGGDIELILTMQAEPE